VASETFGYFGGGLVVAEKEMGMDDELRQIVSEIKSNMDREILFEKIVDLRDQGKSYRDISRITGLRVRQIWDMLHIV
jgi:hypothetical protein